jgi:hypothetical protein
MKLHTTNYKNTFITAAPDCPATTGTAPAPRGSKKTVAELQYELLHANPFTLTSDALYFAVHTERLGLSAKEVEAKRDELWVALFEKPQACLRASALAKTYGWGFEFDDAGRVALVAIDSPRYRQLAKGKQLNVLAAMRSKKA